METILFFQMIGEYRVEIEYYPDSKRYFSACWVGDDLIQSIGKTYQECCENFILALAEYQLMDSN